MFTTLIEKRLQKYVNVLSFDIISSNICLRFPKIPSVFKYLDQTMQWSTFIVKLLSGYRYIYGRNTTVSLVFCINKFSSSIIRQQVRTQNPYPREQFKAEYGKER